MVHKKGKVGPTFAVVAAVDVNGPDVPAEEDYGSLQYDAFHVAPETELSTHPAMGTGAAGATSDAFTTAPGHKT